MIPEKPAVYTNDMAANDQPQVTEDARGSGMCAPGVLAQ